MPIITAPGGSATPANIDTEYERVGFTATGTGTQLTSSGSVNTKGGYTQLSAAIANDWAGFWLFRNVGSATGARANLDLGVGGAGSEVVKFPDFFGSLGTGAGMAQVSFVPLNIAAGSRVAARIAGATASITEYVHILGVKRTANHPPLWDNCERITSVPAGSPAGTLPSDTDITAVTAANTGWTELVHSLARNYGALLPSLSVQKNGTVASTTQQCSFRLGLGAAAAEASFFSEPHYVFSGNPTIARFSGIPIYKAFNAGDRLSGEVLAATAGANDKFCAGVHGFY